MGKLLAKVSGPFFAAIFFVPAFAMAQETRESCQARGLLFSQTTINGAITATCVDDPNAVRDRQACTTATQAYNTAKAEMRKSGCGTPSACEAAADRCSECTAAGIEEGGTCGGGSSAASALGNMFGAPDDSGHRAVVNRLNYCPIFSRDELERIREKKDDYKEKMDDAETELQELTTEAEESAGKIQDMQVQMQEILDQKNLDQQRAIEDRSDELKAKLEENNTKLEQKLMEIEILQADRQNKTQAILNRCHAQALEQVNVLKEQRQGRIAANQLYVQSLNQLTALSSSRSRLQEKAREFFEQCKNDMRTKGDFAALEAEFRLKMQLINNEVQAIQTDSQQTIQKYADQTQDRQLQRELQNIESEATKDYRAKERELRSEQRKLEGLRGQIQLLQRRKQEAEMMYNRYLEQEAAAGDNTGGEMTHTEFLGAFDEFQSAAAVAYTACNCDADSASASSTDLNTNARIQGAACSEFERSCEDGACANSRSDRTMVPVPRVTPAPPPPSPTQQAPASGAVPYDPPRPTQPPANPRGSNS